MNMIESFSTRLTALRVQRSLSKSALARTVGVSTTCVWNWEEGNTHPRPDALERLAAALSTTGAYLDRGVGPERHETPAKPADVLDAAEPVGELIRRARQQIAEAAGLKFEQVKIVLEYGA